MKKIIVGISHGDINGISYEIMLKTFNDPRICEFCTPVIFGSVDVLTQYKRMFELHKFSYQVISDLTKLNEQKVNIFNCIPNQISLNIGQSTKEAGLMALTSLEMAVNELQEGNIDLLVTAPINKENIHSEDFPFKGHTEYLQDRLGQDRSLMFMVSDQIKVGLVCNHKAIEEVAPCVTKESIDNAFSMIVQSLTYDFGIQKPRIAMLSLNPHAGDNGIIGKEEQEIILPYIQQKQSEGFLVYGPFASDGFFGNNSHEKYDAILAMYHDQGLIPFKMLASDNGVNFTAGLPFVRTSPAHGTAYDIAGKNVASEDSFRKAIYMAIDIFRNRLSYNEANANPLKRSSIAHSSTHKRGRNQIAE